ncbi:MAG: hypothetical protein PCALPYG08_0635 [uncultured Paraburkholderia sp.]|nr:MAG: hypothetical protein PCALPYG08_0635 [uncultured Paraburkholderia sp.]
MAGGEKDGTSGLRDATASFAAQRKNVEGLAHIVFCANPKQIRFWLGKESASVSDLESQYNGRKTRMRTSTTMRSTASTNSHRGSLPLSSAP